MKKNEVPQDNGINEGQREVCYAVDENGRYVQAHSLGWEPKNVVLDQAWEVIRKQIAEVIEKIKANELSPLAYYMTKNLMDYKLLAQYAGYSKRRVKKHLKAKHFEKLDETVLQNYASLFKISVEELKVIGEQESE